MRFKCAMAAAVAMVVLSFTGSASAHLHPGVGRFMQRDPLEQVDGPGIYRDYAVINGVDPTGRQLQLTVIQPPRKLSDCGSFEFKVRFDIEGNANGWIIQHVVWTAVIYDCQGNRVPSQNPHLLEYWEAWQVRQGIVFVGGSTTPHQSDTFRTADEGVERKGSVEVSGHAAFFENYNLTEPPWGHTVPAAGSLPSMTEPPPGVNIEPGASGVVSHRINVFICCCGGRSSGAIYEPI